MNSNPEKIRNIAVIAHVDHGKTTLVDALLKQTHTFRDNQAEMQAERIMDHNELERERGITIMAKTCAIEYQGYKINIIDTPGHADFSGEVERTLGMADGALLIVDAQEGPMPQTRFVLKIALQLNLKIIVVINKIDKQLAQPAKVVSQVENLFLEFAQTEDQLNFPLLYAVGREGTVHPDLHALSSTTGDTKPLLDTIIKEIPSPPVDPTLPAKMLVSALDYDSHLGQLLIGRIHQGTLHVGQSISLSSDANKSFPITKLFINQGIERINVDQVISGDIVMLSGVPSCEIGDTLVTNEDRHPLPKPSVSKPTISITLGANTSPYSGREGKFTTSRQIGERLHLELQNNVSLEIEDLDNGKYKVSGRGELHLAILLETLRREGYEMEIGKPEVIIKQIHGVPSEPVEEIIILVPQVHVGTINQELGKRLAKLVSMNQTAQGEVEFVYLAPTRAILGLRTVLLTQTQGTAVINSQLLNYAPVGEPLPQLRKGALISGVTGKAVEYGLRNLKGRGASFIQPGIQVYEGMIIGINAKDEDITMNVCKEKNLTNHRSKSHQGITQLAPDMILSLEQSLDFIEADELLEITPESLRLRKKHLSELQRKRQIQPIARS
jgi:GTP-binding protein